MTIVLDYTLMFVSQFPLLIKVHQSLCSCYHLKPSPYMAETQMPPKIVKNHQHHPIRHPVILKLHQNPPVLHQFSSIFIMFHDFSSCFDPFFHHFSPHFLPGDGHPVPCFLAPGLSSSERVTKLLPSRSMRRHRRMAQVSRSSRRDVVSWITDDD